MPKKQVVNIELFASDGASPVFKKAAQNANALKQSIEAVSKASALKGNWLGSVENTAREAAAVRQKIVAAQAKSMRGSFATGLGATAAGGGSLFDSSYLRAPALSGIQKAQAEAAQKAKGLARGMEEVEASTKSFGGMLAANRIALVAWGAAVFTAGKVALDAAVMVDRLNKAYTTIEGSSVGARVQLDYMYRTTQELGLQFYRTAEASKNFFASMKGTSIESEANKIWTGVAKAATALSLSETDVERVFRALGQMVSKGKVQAEEIRGQLGEVLPGAFTLAANAMKIATAELDKMLERGEVLAEELLPKMAVELEKTYGEAAQQAANGLQQNLNRVSTEWETFKASVLNSENVARTLRRIADGMKSINDENTRNERKRLAEPEMRKAGIAPEGLEWAPTGEYSVPVYTDAQYDAWFARQEKAAEAQKQTADAARQTEETLTRTSGIINAYIVNTYDVQRKLIEDRYTAVKKALDDKIAEYKKAGTDIADLLKVGELIETVHAQDLTALETRFRRKDPGVLAKKQADRDKRKAEKEYKQETRDLDMVADVMQELAQKTGQYGLAVSAVNELIDRQGELWLKAGVPQGYVDQLKEIRRLEASTDGLDKMKLGWMEFYSESMDWGTQAGSVLTGTVDSFSASLAEMAINGKASFSDLARSMASDLTKIATKMMMVWAIEKALGWAVSAISIPNATDTAAIANGFSSANPAVDMYAGMFHKGGVVGSSSGPSRLVPSSLFAGAPRFHGGTGYVKPGEYPAILKAGERVLNPAETRAYQNGPRVNLIINNNASGVDVQTSQRENADGSLDIEATIVRVVDRDMNRRGGIINQSMRKNWGQRSIVTKR